MCDSLLVQGGCSSVPNVVGKIVLYIFFRVGEGKRVQNRMEGGWNGEGEESEFGS